MKTKILLLVLSALLGWHLQADVFEVMDSNANELTIRFTLPDWELGEIERGNQEWDYIKCESSSISGEAGKPELPYFTGSVGIPVDGDIQIVVLGSSPEIRNQVKIVPALRDYLDGDELAYEYAINENIYSQTANYPGSIAAKGYTAMAGDRRFYSFQVYPFQYQPGIDKLNIYDEIVIRILISGTKEEFRGEAAGSILDKVGSDFILNDEISHNWRMARVPDESFPLRNSGVVDTYRLVVDQEGIYKVTYEYLTTQLAELEYDAGFSWGNINPRYLELRDENGTVPLNFIGESDGSFDPGDYFEFHGDIHHGETTWYDDYTSENVYYLSLADHLGSRMMVENGGLVESNSSNYTLPESFEQTLHIEEQNKLVPLGAQSQYQGNMYYFREDIFWWGELSAPDMWVYPFELQYPHASNIRKASASVCLFGLTYDGEHPTSFTEQNKHRAIVRINSTLIDDIGNDWEWIGQHEQMFENLDVSGNPSPILNNDLVHGENVVSISLPNLNNIYEKVLFDYLDLTYWREYKTDEDWIKFHKPYKKPIGTPQPFGLFQFDLDGFSTDEVSIYKLGSSVIENLTVISLSEEGTAPYRISFQDSVLTNETEYYAVTESQKHSLKGIYPDYPSNWKTAANGSEYVIITVEEFAEAAAGFEEFWEEQEPGLNVEIVLLQDIFDEFNSGIRSAESIKDFLEYTYNNWSPRPTHCLLLGEGLLDERDNNPYRWANKIPTKVVWLYARGATASDNWYGCVAGNDPVSDISISRLNVTQAGQIATVINKTESFMTQQNHDDNWHSSITLATGGKASEGNIFSMQSERIRNNSIPPEYRIARVYCNVTDMPQQYSGNTTTLINSINDGTLYVQFMGHGASNQWDDYDLFDIYDVNNLNNDNLFIGSSMSCYGSAFFDGAGISCIGEALTLDSQGAIGQIGFTGFGFLYQDEIYSQALLAAITNPSLETLGDIIDYTKTVFYAEAGTGVVAYSLLEGSALLGDPFVKINLPELGTEIELNKFNYAKGDSLILTAQVGADIERGKFYIYDENDSQVSANEFYPFSYDAVDGEVVRIATIPGSDILPGETYNRNVKFSGFSQEREIVGKANFSIGLPGAYNISWEPEEPDPDDEIDITANFYDDDGVDSVACHIKIYATNINPFNEAGSYTSHYYSEMVRDDETGLYHLESPIQNLPYNYCIRFDFVITDSLQNISYSSQLPNENFIRIRGVKFKLSDFGITAQNNQAKARLSLFNNGNKASGECSLKLYLAGEMTLLDSIRIDSLDVGEQRWEYLNLPLLNGNYSFTVKVNEEEEFSGSAQLNTAVYEIQLFEAGVEAVTVLSLDGNLSCNFPAGLLNESAIFSLVKETGLSAINQPDLAGIMLQNGESSPAYSLNCLDSGVLVDSLVEYPGNGRVELSFSYGAADRRESKSRDVSRYSVYKWNADFQKWVFQTMGANSGEETVSYLSDKIGVYSVFDNQDQTAPSIDVNVEGQEFTYGGYVSENGLISFLLGDQNGVDIIENELSFIIDGENVESENYSINAACGRLSSVPVKYQMQSMPEGIHYLQMSCRDFNGNVFERELSFEVKADFDLIKVANYPNPVKSMTIDPINTGRTRFTYVLTDDADKVTIKVYTVSGRLVKTFSDLPASIGYHEYPQSNIGWDCRDEMGDYLANGIYFYKVIARKGSSKIEKIQKMAILK
ncbi:MAG: C25 family cysteine peptidase [Candidatus Stygibacter australis]|nr:C25 family cysteine peptidase [Candidatus Stygibacter australis]MDP8322256.1 C25 family cysteine peptidase [Candidatus Stygibacter australis]